VDQIDDGREERDRVSRSSSSSSSSSSDVLNCCGCSILERPTSWNRRQQFYFFLFSRLYSLHHKYNQLVRINLSILH
jgi:anthranilate phosphoribosyltransferase